MLLFANYSTGFKSGGFNSGGGTLVLGQRRIFNSETVKNYELGVKSTSAGGRAVLNATLYRMDVHNLQDRAFDGVSLTVRNAADLRQQGVEFDGVVRPFGEFRLNAAAAYLDSGFLRYPNASGLPAFGGTQDLKGKPATYSPKWQGSVGAQYDFLLGGAAAGYNLSLRSDLSFISDSNIGLITDNNPQTVQPAYQLVSARLTLYAPSDRWSIAAYGDNLFDKGYCTSIFAQTLDSIFGVRNPATGGTLMRCTVGTPRMIGARVEAKF
jgi:iron complex outermembrane receptor protein